MSIGIVSYERLGERECWTYCSRAARERGLPLRLLGFERRVVFLVGARGYTCVASRQKSRTHSRLQTIDRRARRHEWSTGILDKGGGRSTYVEQAQISRRLWGEIGGLDSKA